MNSETLNKLIEVEEDYVKDAETLDALLDTADKEKALITLDKAQKLEHDERKLRLEEEKHQLELAKEEHRVKMDKIESGVKVGTVIVAGVTAAGALAKGIAELVKICLTRKYVREAYAIDGVTTLTSKTARDLLSSCTNPR